MRSFVVVTRDGEEKIIVAEPGHSVMQVIRDSGLDELQALCGGNCACATCHVYVDTHVGNSEPNADESELLDSSEHRQANSRLSCQLLVDDLIDGSRIVIAPED